MLGKLSDQRTTQLRSLGEWNTVRKHTHLTIYISFCQFSGASFALIYLCHVLIFSNLLTGWCKCPLYLVTWMAMCVITWLNNLTNNYVCLWNSCDVWPYIWYSLSFFKANMDETSLKFSEKWKLEHLQILTSEQTVSGDHVIWSKAQSCY